MSRSPVAADAVYLFKSASRPLYRQQNLQILAAERGTVVELAWNRSWVGAELFDADSIAPGTPAVIVLTDRPHTLFVPIRAAEIVEARWESTSLRLWVALNTWVSVAGDDLTAYTAAIRDTHGGNRPGEKFVMRRRDGARLVACYDDEQDRAWRRAVDHVLTLSNASEHDAYRGAVFFRPAALQIDGHTHESRYEPLRPGAEAQLIVRAYNPHLTHEQRARLQLRAVAAKDEMKVAGGGPLPGDGDLRFTLRPLARAPELALQIEPQPTQHTRLLLRFPARRGADGAPAELAGVGRAALLELYDLVQRSVRPEPAAELAVLDAFARLLPDEAKLTERRALARAAVGDDAGAFELLRELDGERLDDDARFLLFRLHARRGAVTAAATLIAPLDLEEAGRLGRLLHELDALQPPLLDRTVRALLDQLVDLNDLQRVLAHAAPRLTSAELIADCARAYYVATDDARAAAALVTERRRTLNLSQPVIADVIMELARAGAADDDLGDVARHRIVNLIGRGELEEARAALRAVTPALPRTERDRLYHQTVDRLHEFGRDDDAAALLVELAYAALATGDVDSASDAVQRATGLLAANGTPLPGSLKEASARVRRAWEECEELIEWQENDRERRAAELRARLRNRRILIVGGLKREGQEQRLRELTGAEIDFGEHFRTEGDSLSNLAQRIRGGRYALVVLRWQFTSHEAADTIRKACSDAAVPFAWATSGGRRGLEEAISSAAQ